MANPFRIDLFSDTNCSTPKGMRQAMAQAEVGNEVAGEDPTVNLLLERVCDILGKEAAIFLPSGSMCNTLSFRTHCRRPGDGIVFEQTSHPILKNNTIFSGLVQATPILLEGKNGTFTADQLVPILERDYGYNEVCPALISVENPTNYGGGAIWSLNELKAVSQLSKKHAVPIHMDGARLFVIQAKNGTPLEEYAQMADSVFVDFCKTLGAPMGAVLAGSKDFIDEVWFHKFQFGGYMHKAGFLAAACLYGLDHHLELIPELIQNAESLANGLSELLFYDVEFLETNIVHLKTTHPTLSAYEIEAKLAEQRIRVHAYEHNMIRMIVHLDIKPPEILEIVENFGHLCRNADPSMKVGT
jgi:threonine aldolase